VSQENVELVRRGLTHRQATGDFLEEIIAPDFVWDMSKFTGWPERQVYGGIEGARSFIRDWTDAWDGWEFEAEEFHDAGEQVVVVSRQHGRSKATGMPVDMSYAQVFTVRGGKQVRMEMYASRAEALKAAGLEE
jgi:ketosteroid isomerase-like protein